MYKKSLTVIVLGCFLLVCESAQMRDPTRPAVLAAQEDIPVINVESIIYSPGRKIAIVDGKMVSPGDFISDFKVIDIDKDKVIFQGISGEFSVSPYLDVKQRPTKGSPK